MTSLSILFCINAVIAGIALVRVRPASLIVAGNSMITIDALNRIAKSGRPDVEWFVPAPIFNEANIHTGTILFSISSAILLFFALLPGGRRLRKNDPISFPALPLWLLLLLAAYYAASFFSSKTILEAQYTNAAWNISGFNLGGANPLMHSLVLYEVYRRVHVGVLRPLAGFGLVLLIFTLTDFSKGSTGMAAGYVIVAAVLMASFGARGVTRSVVLGTGLLSCLACIYVVRSIRPLLHEVGVGIVGRVSTSTVQSIASGNELENDNGTQYATHVLECIALYDSGVSREWRSIYNPFIYTFEPSFLLEPLGIQRPKEAAWELADYFIHGGGIYVLGELYWNGGYACVVLMLLAISLWCYLCDTRYRRSLLWLICACAFSPGILQGFGYGFAQVVRGFFNGWLILAGLGLLGMAASRRLGRRQRPVLQTRTIRGHRGKDAPIAHARRRGWVAGQ